ncbi:MAG: CBS domain-containing protein [Candidatus Palauibacterales bacterium]|nr:CBS domain-containing protein [Candidatus Palauibacterales bacterium]
MKVRDILDEKGRQVVTTAPDQSIREAARMFVHHGLGAMPVVEDGELRGMISERDALRVAMHGSGSWESTRVAAAMAEELFVVTEDDDLDYLMDVITVNRIRHLPVVDGNELRGLVSIGDALKAARGDQSGDRTFRRYFRGRFS